MEKQWYVVIQGNRGWAIYKGFDKINEAYTFRDKCIVEGKCREAIVASNRFFKVR